MVSWSPSYKPEDYPKTDYPTIKRGVVHAKRLRLESLDGSEMYLDGGKDSMPDGVLWRDVGKFLLDEVRPFEKFGQTWGVSHMQKYSTYGWLFAEPNAYHHWLFWRPQQKDANGGWLPGSERGLYFRRPFSWRWDVAGTKIDGELKHWIYSGGIISGHWD